VAGAVTIRLPRSLAERLEREAGRPGISLEEYVLELLLGDVDPPERAREYAEAARDLLEAAREELEGGCTPGCWEGLGCGGARREGIRRVA
jgi:hypothetical protein